MEMYLVIYILYKVKFQIYIVDFNDHGAIVNI